MLCLHRQAYSAAHLVQHHLVRPPGLDSMGIEPPPDAFQHLAQVGVDADLRLSREQVLAHQRRPGQQRIRQMQVHGVGHVGLDDQPGQHGMVLACGPGGAGRPWPPGTSQRGSSTPVVHSTAYVAGQRPQDPASWMPARS